ncbi:MAG: DUF222 domain-containing protein [Acidimicrobiia bacterium]|nr:DUF222 domain-containing protein [Acidimicrobiia bacterium]
MGGTEQPGGVVTATSAFAGESEQVVLDAELNEIAGHLNTQHARLVDATVELLANPGRWRGDGVWTAQQYLCWRVGLAPARAVHIVEIAERVGELPICTAAFRSGELAIDAMAAIAKRVPWWADQTACNYGTAMTVSQLRHVLARYPFPDIAHPDDVDNESDTTRPGTATDDNANNGADTNGTDTASDDTAIEGSVGHSDDSDGSGESSGTDEIQGRPVEAEPDGRCGFGWNNNGRFGLSLDTDAVTGAIIETALTEARDHLFNNGHTNVNWLDAIREVCQRSLDSITEPSRRDRYRINIHLNTTNTDGVDANTDANAVDGLGWRLPDAIGRHLTCDGSLSPVFVADSVPISVGRSQRIVPERTRRQVILRDHGCRVPGCNRHQFLEVHHIIHWEHHGPTDTWNLICLCPHHHRLHHQNKLGITGNADTPGAITFTNQAGNPIAQTGTKPKPPETLPPSPAGIYRHPSGERLHTKWIYFNPPPGHHEGAQRSPMVPDTG